MPENFTKALAVFARAPQPGQVKSRLARDIGENAAARCYCAFLRDTLRLAARAQRALPACRTLVAHTPDDAFELATDSLAPFWDGSRLPQIGEDLGARMLHCIQSLQAQNAAAVVIIGSDSPDLKFEFIERAFELLQTHALVFGPADDGGFYLVGANQKPFQQLPNLFDNVTWSTQSTLHQVLSNAKRLDLKTALLPKWSDVDTLEDLVKLAERLKSEYSDAPHTQQWLRSQNLL